MALAILGKVERVGPTIFLGAEGEDLNLNPQVKFGSIISFQNKTRRKMVKRCIVTKKAGVRRERCRVGQGEGVWTMGVRGKGLNGNKDQNKEGYEIKSCDKLFGQPSPRIYAFSGSSKQKQSLSSLSHCVGN